MMKLPVKYHEVHFSKRKLIRNEYVRLQEGKCYHCGCDLNGDPSSDISSKKVNTSLFPEGFFDWPVHLHHSRKNGMTIGAVHAYCNAVLWQYHGE